MILGALVAVYLVLGVLYESYIHPLTILSTLPSAGVGALLSIYALGGEFSLISLLGLFLLIGVVKKNAILMIDLALQLERSQGMAPLESIRSACLQRLRPILMTTLAAILGALPLLMSRAEGAKCASPGPDHHRRADLQPGADALHHPGGLPLSRQTAPSLQ